MNASDELDDLNPAEELDALIRFRADTPAMTHRTLVQGRLRVMDEIHGKPARGLGRVPRRRAAILAGAAVGLGLVGSQLVGLTGTGPTAQAATVLTAAASAVESSSGPAPRQDQFVYLRILHVTSGMRQTMEIWTSADGSRQGLSRSRGFLGSNELPVETYRPAEGLRQAPYTVLAKLPTDPAALLKVLYADPAVSQDVTHNKVSRDVAVWGLIRDLVQNAPAVQKAALFKAAATIHGITYVADAADAAGRSGEAVGLPDPRLGSVQFIFDKTTHAFLGERILAQGSTTKVQFNDTVERVAVVDKAGQAPTP
jgi:hypothetical protein